MHRQRFDSRARDLLCVALLAALVAFLTQRLLTGRAGLGPEARLDGDALFGSGHPRRPRAFDDLTSLVIETPRDRWLAGRMRAGHFDLWNPLQGTGVPLPPDQGGLFDPLRVCHLLFPDPFGYALFHCVRLWIAAVGTFFLARTGGTSRPGALLAGVLFGVGGGMISQLPFVSPGPVCVFPWVLLAQARLLRRPSAWGQVLVGVAVAATLVAGHPTLAAAALMGAALAGIVALARAGGDRLRRLLELAGGWTLGIAFAAPYLFTFAEYVANGFSYKHSDSGLQEYAIWVDMTRGSLGPALAAPATLDALRDTVSPRAFPYLLHFVAGTTGWVLAGVGILRRRVPAHLLALLAAGVILSIEPLGFGFGHVPILRDILARYYWPLVIVPVACAAGAGADALSRPAGYRWILPALGLFALVVLAALALPRLTETPRSPQAFALWMADLRGVPLRYHLAVCAGLAAALVAGRLSRRRRDVTTAGMLLAGTVELVLLMRPHLREPRSEALRRPIPAPAARLAEATIAAHARMSAKDTDITMAPLPSLAGIPDVRMTAPLVPERYADFLRAAGAIAPLTFFGLPRVPSAWSDLAAVRYVVADAGSVRSLSTRPSTHVRDPLPSGAVVLESSTASGRARLFFGAETVPNRVSAALRLRALAGAGALGDRLVLEPAGAVRPGPLAGKGSADVRWILDEPDEIVLETDSASFAYLMLADTYYPGWRARVDGASAPVFPADVGFRAVPVPPGKHLVRFVYRPLSLWAGVATALAAIAVAGLAVSRERRRRTSRLPAPAPRHAHRT